MAGPVVEHLDFGRQRPALGRDRGTARVSVRMARVPGTEDLGRAGGTAGRPATVRGRDLLPLSVRRVRVRVARGAGHAGLVPAAVATAGRGRHSARARLLDVRLLLSLHEG